MSFHINLPGGSNGMRSSTSFAKEPGKKTSHNKDFTGAKTPLNMEKGVNHFEKGPGFLTSILS